MNLVKIKRNRNKYKNNVIASTNDSGFADGRSKASPDSEKIEQTATKLQLRNISSVEQIQDSECAAIQKNSYRNDWIASSDLCPPRNDRRKYCSSPMGTQVRANEERVLRDCVQGAIASRRLGGVQHRRVKFAFCRPLSPTPSPAGRGEKMSAFTLAETPHRSGYSATNFDKTQRLLRSAGFTLAEVLITIGIIGVVSAMTIPNLMTNYKVYRLKTQFWKSYSTLSQVIRRMNDDGVLYNPSEYEVGEFYKLVLKYISGGLDCGMVSTGSDK
ncbi:type II secretion system protein, partial [bacterium]|nr:type II secretion system protein [bacterium]